MAPQVEVVEQSLLEEVEAGAAERPHLDLLEEVLLSFVLHLDSWGEASSV